MTTIPKNSKRIAQLKQELTECTVYSLGNYFLGKSCEPRYAWDALHTALHPKLTEHDGKFTVHVHDNLWYELQRPSS